VTALLLDTHTWIWLAAGDRRVARHERTLDRAAHSNELLLSAISVYEAALIGLETDSGRHHVLEAELDCDPAHATVHPREAARPQP
jgi:PIN domain nuclease of toxin-antitoxin system